MKHLDQLLDELQDPIAQLMDWCDVVRLAATKLYDAGYRKTEGDV